MFTVDVNNNTTTLLGAVLIIDCLGFNFQADLRPDNVEPETDPEIEKIVQQCWEEVDKQCISYERPKPGHRQTDNIGWKTVRLFVSSTFTDFYCEREILVKKVC